MLAAEVPVPVPPADPPPPPPQRRLLLGAEAHRDGRPDLDVFREFQEAAGGNVNMRVTYSRGLPDTFQDHAAYGDGLVGAAYSWLSVKTFDPDGLYRFMDSIPVAQRERTIVTVWHEPEDNILNQEFSVQEWTDIQNHAALIGNDLGIATAAVLMTWTWDARSGRDPRAYADGSFVHPMIGFDGYDDTGRYTPSELLAGPLKSAQDWGIENWGIRETGTARQGQANRNVWWRSLWEYTDIHGGSALCPWDSNHRQDWPWCALTTEDRVHLGQLAS